jgi:tetraacyldisaccharide-1-P 4'-kinase
MAGANGLTLVTTEKDAVRFPGMTMVLPVALALDAAEEARLTALLSARTQFRP